MAHTAVTNGRVATRPARIRLLAIITERRSSRSARTSGRNRAVPRMRRLVAMGVASLLLVSLAGGGAVARSGAPRGAAVPQNPGLFLDILPAGQGTSTNAAAAARFQATRDRPKHDV